MTGLDAYLASLPGRCTHGYHLALQGCTACAPIAPTGAVTEAEWAVFTAALREAAVDGVVSQTKVRPLIKGRIYHKHIGAAYKRAKEIGLLELIDKEPSTDVAGGNTDKDQKVYRLRSAA